MPAKTYKSKQTPAFGPNKRFYYNLTSIAIDYIENFKRNSDQWSNVPKNVTNVKMSIIKILLNMREGGGSNLVYTLDQSRLLTSLQN